MINATGIPDAHVLYPEAPAGGLLEGTAIYVNWYSHYFNWYARRVADDETLAKFLSVAEIDFVIQPKAPEGRFSVLLGSYLGKTRRPVAEFGDVLVYRTDRPHAAVR
jgi:hypothetical protein